MRCPATTGEHVAADPGSGFWYQTVFTLLQQRAVLGDEEPSASHNGASSLCCLGILP